MKNLNLLSKILEEGLPDDWYSLVSIVHNTDLIEVAIWGPGRKAIVLTLVGIHWLMNLRACLCEVLVLIKKIKSYLIS